MHLCTAEGLFINDLIDGHLHEWRSAEVRGSSFLHEDGVVTHAGGVGPARSVWTEGDGDGWDTELRELRDVLELLTAAHEDVGLAR